MGAVPPSGRTLTRAALVLLLALFLGGLTACEPPPSDGWFNTLPPGASLPSEAQCRDRVHRTGWEPRPQNREENQNAPNLNGISGYGGMSHKAETWGRVRGSQTGTTDVLIQFYACKWGLDDNVIRAEAIVESNWDMDQLGDFGDCGSGASSYGLLQIKKCAHPGTYPYSANSTSFNLDYYGAVIRGCYNGWDYVTSQPGNFWGCIDRWFSGGLNPNSQYVGWVKTELAQKDWLEWDG